MTTPAPYTPLVLPEPLSRQLREEGWSVAVTGAGGWMGSALMEMLEPVYGAEFGAHVAGFGSTARMMTLRSGRNVALRPVWTMAQLNPGKWLLAHCAYGTKDKVSAGGEQAFVSANRALSEAVRDATETLKPKAIFFPSSGAVYTKSGAIDADMERNPYGVLKSEDERHFTKLAERLSARIVIPRVFNMSGPYINKWSAYALSDLIVQMLDGCPVTIQSPGPVLRSYVHVQDTVSLCLAILLNRGNLLPPFDTYGDEEVEVAALAQRIARVLGMAPPTSLRAPDLSLAGSRYLGKREPMHGLCREYGLTLATLDRQIQDTAEDILRRRATPAAAIVTA